MAPYQIGDAFNTHGNDPLLPRSRILGSVGFESNYIDIMRAARRGREATPISLDDLRGSVNQLATLNGPVTGASQIATARSLMFLIQFTSEAARFTEVARTFQTAVGTPGSRIAGLPLEQQYIENSWDQISRYAFAVTNQPFTPPFNVTGVGTFHSFNDVQARVETLMGQTSFVNQNGDWAHTEL